MNKLNKSLLYFVLALGFITIEGCRKTYYATADHKALYGWDMFKEGKFEDSRVWFQNSVNTDVKWQDGYNGLGWSYAKLMQADSSEFYFNKGLAQTPKTGNLDTVKVQMLAGLLFANSAIGSFDKAIINGNQFLHETKLTPTLWQNWIFSHDTLLNYLDLRIALAGSYFAQKKFDSTNVQVKYVLDDLADKRGATAFTEYVLDHTALAGRSQLARQIDSLQCVLSSVACD